MTSNIKNEIEKILTVEKGSIVTSENSIIEFKKSFNWLNKVDYGKIMASFANNEGGYLLFGYDENGGKFEGLNNSFRSTDSSKISQFLNNTFSPVIKWDKEIILLDDNEIGVIKVYPSNQKPIIAKKFCKAGEIQEGDIFYRYVGENKRIQYSELRKIIDAQIEKSIKILNLLLDKISISGVDNIAILDARSGEIEGFQNKIIIDEKLIKKINFIKEGHFNEVDGEPTLKLVGEIESSSIVIKKEPTVMTFEDITIAFLEQKIDRNIPPIEYIKRICHENSANFPIYYFIEKSNSTINQIYLELEKVVSATKGKERLLNRIKENKKDFSRGKIGANTKQGKDRQVILDKINSGKVPSIQDISGSEIRFLEVVSNLMRPQITGVQDSLFQLMLDLFKSKYSNQKGNFKSLFRLAVCNLDVQLYFSEFENHSDL